MRTAYPAQAVLLCAGGSRRMGQNKALLDWNGRSLLRWHLAAYDGVASVIVVLGAEADRVRAVLPRDVVAVENRQWEETGPVDSLRLALLAVSARGPCFVSPVDVVPPHKDTLSALVLAGAPAVPRTPAGEDGHPVFLDDAVISAVLTTRPPGGLRDLLRAAHRVTVQDPLAALDFDDPAALDRVRSQWRAS